MLRLLHWYHHDWLFHKRYFFLCLLDKYLLYNHNCIHLYILCCILLHWSLHQTVQTELICCDILIETEANTNKINMKNVDCSDCIDEIDHYVQHIHFDCLHLHFSMWFAEIVNRKSVVSTAVKCLCWHCKNRKNITGKDNCKHCSDKMNNKKIKILEIDHINKMNNYWKHYLIVNIVAAVNSAALMMIWLWSYDSCTYQITLFLYFLCLQWTTILWSNQ